MKNKIILLIGMIFLVPTLLVAQYPSPNLPFVDTIRKGNSVVIRTTTFSDSIPIPFDGADPREVYRIAESEKGTNLTQVTKSVNFFLHTIEHRTEYRYDAHVRLWKISHTEIKDRGVQNQTLLSWCIFFVLFIIRVVDSIRRDEELIDEADIILTDFILSFVVIAIAFVITPSIFGVSPFIGSMRFYDLILLVVWMLTVLYIRYKKTNKEKEYEPSHQ